MSQLVVVRPVALPEPSSLVSVYRYPPFPSEPPETKVSLLVPLDGEVVDVAVGAGTGVTETIVPAAGSPEATLPNNTVAWPAKV